MNKSLLKQIIRFAIVGAIATLIDFGILFLLKNLCGWDPTISNGISFTISLIINYLLSMRFVFNPDEKLSKQKQFLIFVITSVIGLGLSELIMYFGTKIFGTDNVTVLIIKILSTGIIMVYNYVSKKLLLEPHKKKSEEQL